MKAQPIKECSDGSMAECPASEATHVHINLPVVGSLVLPVVLGNKDRRGTPYWNGDMEKPTLKPSILNDPYWRLGEGGRSHCWVNDGMVHFLNDCTHDLKGKTVVLEDVDRDFFKVEKE